MGSYLLNSGGSTTRFASLYPRPASEPRQSGHDVQGDVAEWKRLTGRPLKATAITFGQILDRLLDHRNQADRMRSAWFSRLLGGRSSVTWVRR
jgi:hypothetical protein